MHSIFVSDLHLSTVRPDLVTAFVRFVGGPARGTDALYILGDLFDLWLGDDAPDPAGTQVAPALAALAASGVRVYLMHGNRDFLIRERFTRTCGATLLPDPAPIDLYGTPTLLTHGDMLCTDDLEYQHARARYRRPWMEGALLAMPRFVRAAIGRHFRDKSERNKRRLPPTVMDVNAGAVEAALRAYSCTRMIHGHTHRPARHEHRVEGHRCERWVLADWYARGSYLRCDPAGCTEIELPMP